MQLQGRSRVSLTPQQLRVWYACWDCRGGSSGSRPGVGSSGASCSGPVQQQRPPRENLSPQELREWPVAVSLADPSGGPVLATSTTALPCPAVPSGTLSGLYLPSFSTNLVAGSTLQDVGVHQFTHAYERVTLHACPDGSSPGYLHSAAGGRQRATPHSSKFPPIEAPLQTLHMDVWSPARVHGQAGERYFLPVVDDYTRYTTVFPLRTKGEVPAILIPWIRATRLHMERHFRTDLPVLRLHSSRGGEFSSGLLEAFYQREGIEQTFTLPASPQ
ncbi:unnamed protein product [Closterium sp. NIES-65]|nr:unnamed protein product [Closterium sp. NIES-65]